MVHRLFCRVAVGVSLVCLLQGCGSAPHSSDSSSSSEESWSEVSSSESASSSSAPMDNTGVFPEGVTRPEIMIVGDSISAGPGCYKKYLDAKLQENGIANYEFVGRYTDDCGGGIMHSAVSCSTTANYLSSSFTLPNCFGSESFPGVEQLMQDYNPDLVMMQLGVNDVWGGSTPVDSVLNNYAQLIQKMRGVNPNIVVVVAQIHKIITDNCSNQAGYENAQRLVNAVPSWAEQLSSDASPIFVADLWTNSDPYDANDCVHPDDVGARKMADNWYEALREILW